MLPKTTMFCTFRGNVSQYLLTCIHNYFERGESRKTVGWWGGGGGGWYRIVFHSSALRMSDVSFRFGYLYFSMRIKSEVFDFISCSQEDTSNKLREI